MNQQTISPSPVVPQPVNTFPVEAAPLWFICPSCRGVLSVPMDRAGMEGPCPTCNTRIRAPRSEDVPPIHEEPPSFAARKTIDESHEKAKIEAEADRLIEERRRQRMEVEWKKNADVIHSRGRKGGGMQKFLDSSWPQMWAITLFVASLIIAWRVLK